MRVGQIRKIKFGSLRAGYSYYGGAFEADEYVTRNCRLILDKNGALKWQIIKKKDQGDWDYCLEVDQECLDNTPFEELEFIKG